MLTASAPVLSVALAAVVGYLFGAVPTGYLVCRLLSGGDLRETGSGHTGGSNVARVAGLPAGIATAVIDALLGVGAVAVGGWLGDSHWAATAAGVMAVVGHNWSVFIRFGGGIGLTSLGGALLWNWPLRVAGVAVALIVLWLVLVKLARVHRARATVLVLAINGLLLWAMGVPLPGITLGVLGGAVAIIKTLPDWQRDYGQSGG